MSSTMYATIKSCSSPVLVYDTLNADATLYWKNDISIKLTDFNNLKCVRIGRKFGSFEKQSVYGSDAFEVLSISKVKFFEAKTDGKIHILLSVSGKKRKDWPWYHIYGTMSVAFPKDVKWGKISPSAALDDEVETP